MSSSQAPAAPATVPVTSAPSSTAATPSTPGTERNEGYMPSFKGNGKQFVTEGYGMMAGLEAEQNKTG